MECHIRRNTLRYYALRGLELRNAAQTATVQYSYDPYGGTKDSVVSTNIVKYTGRDQDLTDLYYYRNRYYKPSVGRFISEDPIGLSGGSNFYGYVGGNPVNAGDPLGFFGSSAEGRVSCFSCHSNLFDPSSYNIEGDYPANPDDWSPPDDWKETAACQKTGGRHRQWNGPDGEWRRWDREGREGGKNRGPHWHDWRYPGIHIDPNR